MGIGGRAENTKVIGRGVREEAGAICVVALGVPRDEWSKLSQIGGE
jgi:hypothetical protein